MPLNLLSGWIHAVASLNPATALLEAGRGFISGDPEVVVPAFGAAFLLVAVFAVWSRTGLAGAERSG